MSHLVLYDTLHRTISMHRSKGTSSTSSSSLLRSIINVSLHKIMIARYLVLGSLTTIPSNGFQNHAFIAGGCLEDEEFPCPDC